MRHFKTVAVCLLALSPARGAQTDNQPVEPFRIAENLYYVGASDVASYLITSLDGHLLIDAGYPDTVPIIRANVTRLGFQMKDIRILLSTQAHVDHAGGFAAMKQLTGARLMVSEADAPLVARGGLGDFLFGDRMTFPPAAVDRRLKDGERVRLGRAVLTTHLTPGHTKGTTTWTFDAVDRGHVLHALVLGGLTILDGVRLAGMPDYPNIAEDYERAYRTLKGLPCDLFLGAHLAYFDGLRKADRLRSNPDGPNPFVDPAGCRAYIDRAEQRFRSLR